MKYPAVESIGKVQIGWGVRKGKWGKIGMMDNTRGNTNLCTATHTKPNCAVTIVRVFYSLFSKLHIRILNILGMCNEGYIDNYGHGHPYICVCYVYLLQPRAFSEVLQRDSQQMRIYIYILIHLVVVSKNSK